QLDQPYPSGKFPPLFPSSNEPEVVHLIADYLYCLAQHALNRLNSTIRTPIPTQTFRLNDILWVIGLPACWSDNQIQIMRRAAQLAGLIGDSIEESNRLVFLPEPEAAAIDCQDVMVGPGRRIPPGMVFMVVDAGGGTTDVTVHRVGDGGELNEVIQRD